MSKYQPVGCPIDLEIGDSMLPCQRAWQHDGPHRHEGRTGEHDSSPGGGGLLGATFLVEWTGRVSSNSPRQ